MPETMRHVCGEVVHKADDGFHHRFDRDCKDKPLLSCPRCNYPLEDGWFRALYRIEPMSRGMMERTISGRYACSNCWHYGFMVKDIFTEDEQHLYLVLCVECNEETVGFVSSKYISYARDIDYQDHIYVLNTLGKEFEETTGEKPPVRRSAESILHELGIGL